MVAERDDMDAGVLPARTYRSLVEVALDIIAVLDSQGRIRYINDAVTRVMGYRPAEVVGQPVAAFYHPDDAQRATDRLQTTVAQGNASNQTEIYRLRHRDGSYRHLESLSVGGFDDLDVGGLYLIARDVTERLAAESERAHIEVRRQLAARVARFGIWEWNSRTDELIASEAVRHLVRTQPTQQWTGAGDFLQRLLPDDRSAAQLALRNAAAGKPVEGLVVRMPLPDGTLRWLYLHAQNMNPEAPPSEWILGLVMDITEQKLAQQEIARRDEMLELATWGAGIGVWIWMPDENRSVYDKRCAELLGIPTDELECTTAALYEPVHPDDLPELKRQEAELLAGKTDVFDYAYRARQDATGWHWVMDRGRVSERDANGRVIRVSGVTLDIDEAKRRERELDDQRLRLDLALDATKLGLWDLDLIKDELFVDQRYTGIVGLSADVLRREYNEFAEHIHEDDRPRLLAAGSECLEGRAGTLNFEGRLLKPDGRMIWIRIEGFVAGRQSNGRPARMIGTISDVSEGRLEEQFTRAGERVAKLGSYEFAAGADRMYWSEGIYDIFELPLDFVAGRGTAQRLFPPVGRTTILDAIRAAEEEGREFDVEAEALTARGRPIWVRMIGRVESFQGKPVRVFGVLQDVTERRRLEAELLEAANREQQKLGSDLHDGLGQELTGIALLLQGLGQQAKAANPSLAKPFDRISSLLSMAIRKTRSLAHGLAPVSVGRGGLASALRILAEQASATYAVPVTLELGPEQSPELGEVAGNHIYRIVQEALSNAVRHGRAGKVTVRLGSFGVDCVLEVVDDGQGIDDNAAQTGGLGLRSMRYRAQAIGGTLSIDKAQGGGTRVRLLCPRPNP
jgi:PAS domain S-box-containing protein